MSEDEAEQACAFIARDLGLSAARLTAIRTRRDPFQVLDRLRMERARRTQAQVPRPDLEALEDAIMSLGEDPIPFIKSVHRHIGCQQSLKAITRKEIRRLYQVIERHEEYVPDVEPETMTVDEAWAHLGG